MDSASYVSRGPPPFLHAHLTHLSCRQMQHLRPKCLRSYLRGKVVAKVAPTTQHTLPTKVSTKFTGSGGSSVGTVRLWTKSHSLFWLVPLQLLPYISDTFQSAPVQVLHTVWVVTSLTNSHKACYNFNRKYLLAAIKFETQNICTNKFQFMWNILHPIKYISLQICTEIHNWTEQQQALSSDPVGRNAMDFFGKSGKCTNSLKHTSSVIYCCHYWFTFICTCSHT